jgi:A/G-specific adenine glycosylase
MAQQTQVARVDDSWADFMARFPTPRRLAEASGADVLRAWAGLGYNRRAINLQRAARIIEARHGGRVPGTVAELEALPGVGPYTSRAVAALAFDRPVSAVDTNVQRVITRLSGQTLAGPDVQPRRRAGRSQRPGDVEPRCLELGATVCRASPDCAACPVSGGTQYRSRRRRRRLAYKRAPGDVPFEQTTRWLRGRIVARLRDSEEGTWTQLPAWLGSHGPERVTAAVAALERDGLVERCADGAVRLPSAAP